MFLALQVQLINMPTHVVNLVLLSEERASSAAMDPRDEGEELFVDMCDQGRIMDWHDLT